MRTRARRTPPEPEPNSAVTVDPVRRLIEQAEQQGYGRTVADEVILRRVAALVAIEQPDAKGAAHC
jgi:hypothetical protein